MIRYLLIFVFIACAIVGISQPYKNEWIDYKKTYYKFPVATQGLFRIPQTALSTVNLGTVNAQDFQLWRDGVEQPIYTSEATGPLSPTGYIEFYGRPLDGSQDDDLFLVGGRRFVFFFEERAAAESEERGCFLSASLRAGCSAAAAFTRLSDDGACERSLGAERPAALWLAARSLLSCRQ